MVWEDHLPLPIRVSLDHPPDLECRCKNCQPVAAGAYDHLHCWGWCVCDLCHKKIWFNFIKCTLYAWRKSKELICFNCRIPFYKLGLTTGEIHRLFRKNNAEIE
jgi:hypothetical protein